MMNNIVDTANIDVYEDGVFISEISNYTFVPTASGNYTIRLVFEGGLLSDGYTYLPSEKEITITAEKRQIAKEVVAIQNKVSALKIQAPDDWNWNSFADEMLGRAHELISKNGFFDVSKVEEVSNILKEIQPYISSVKPIPYLDDISTKNLLIENGHVSGVIDIDWMGFGDKLTFVAMTEVALLNMNLDTNYVDYLLEEMNLNSEQKRAFIFYCLLFCVDFMGERGTQYLDKVVPVNQEIIDRLNSIYDCFMNQWKYYKGVPF